MEINFLVEIALTIRMWMWRRASPQYAACTTNRPLRDIVNVVKFRPDAVTNCMQFKQEAFKNVGPIRHCEPPHAHSPGVSTGTVARPMRIDVHDDNLDHDDNDNA